MNSSNILILKVNTYRRGIYFHVLGETGQEYIVDYNSHKGWICDCPDHLFRHGFCKHMQACHEFLADKGLKLPCNVWYDNPKSDIVVNGESATSHTLVEEAVKNGSYY